MSEAKRPRHVKKRREMKTEWRGKIRNEEKEKRRSEKKKMEVQI